MPLCWYSDILLLSRSLQTSSISPQTIASIATEKNSTILFPLPMSLGLPEVMEEQEDNEEKEEKEERGKEGLRRRILPELSMG